MSSIDYYYETKDEMYLSLWDMSEIFFGDKENNYDLGWQILVRNKNDFFENKDFDLTSYCNSFIENNDKGKIAEFFLTLAHNDEHKEETKIAFKKKF